MIFNVKQGVNFDPALFKIDYKRTTSSTSRAPRTRTASVHTRAAPRRQQRSCRLRGLSRLV